MVVKLPKNYDILTDEFEYGVILNGSQTVILCEPAPIVFEYGVILNGSQTATVWMSATVWFEYGVILNGSQTSLSFSESLFSCLSMV